MFGVVSVFFFIISLSSTGGEVFHPLVFAPEGINQRAPLSPSWCRIFFCACANLMSLKPRYWSFKEKTYRNRDLFDRAEMVNRKQEVRILAI